MDTRLDADLDWKTVERSIATLIEAAYRRGYANGWRDRSRAHSGGIDPVVADEH